MSLFGKFCATKFADLQAIRLRAVRKCKSHRTVLIKHMSNNSIVVSLLINIKCLLLFIFLIDVTQCALQNKIQQSSTDTTIRLSSSAHDVSTTRRLLQPQARNLQLFSSINSDNSPNFDEPIGNQTIAMGKDAQLSCKINNLGAYKTAWLRVEDKGILTIHTNVITRNYRVGLMHKEDAGSFILTIKNAQPSDKGGYMCQINSVPMKSSVGYLDVLTPPVFDDEFNIATTTPGSDVVTAVDRYNNDGTLAQKLQHAPQPANQVTTVTEGSNATLSCHAHGHPAPVISWRREDSQLILLDGPESHSEDKVEDTTTLVFKQVFRFNSGAYLCIASNGIQPSASKRLVLDVQFRPVVRLPQTEVTASLGQSEAQLECIVEQNPIGSHHWVKLPNYSPDKQDDVSAAAASDIITSKQADDLWLIEHDELIQSDKFDIVIKQLSSEKVRMILNVRHVDKQDFSWYKCIARNLLGLQSNVVRLSESAAASQSLTPSVSSSFSLNSIFRSSSQDGTIETQNVPQNDEQSRNGVNSTSTRQQRPHTRFSWIQRSSGSTARQHDNQGSSTVRSIRITSLVALSASMCSTTWLMLLSSTTYSYRIR